MDLLNKILSNHIDEGRFPGIQWQINTKNEIYYGKVGYNNIESKSAVLDNTINIEYQNSYIIWCLF